MIQAENFLGFAKSMPRENETDDRVCISRAYYAAMHKALEYAVGNGYEYSNKEAGGTHSNLIFYFDRDGTESAGVVADLLKKLKRKRIQADYYLNENIYSGEAAQALRRSSCIFAELE